MLAPLQSSDSHSAYPCCAAIGHCRTSKPFARRGVQGVWGMQAHQGEPKAWPIVELRNWLQKHTGKTSEALQQLDKQALVKVATAEAHRLYNEYKPSCNFKYRNIDPTALYLWTPSFNTDAPVTASSAGSDFAKLGLRTAGSIEREFNSMFNFQEMAANIGQTHCQWVAVLRMIRGRICCLQLRYAAYVVCYSQQLRLFFAIKSMISRNWCICVVWQCLPSIETTIQSLTASEAAAAAQQARPLQPAVSHAGA